MSTKKRKPSSRPQAKTKPPPRGPLLKGISNHMKLLSTLGGKKK